MKRKFFLGTGAAILVVAAAFASKAKFAPTGVYYTAGGICNKVIAWPPITIIIGTVAPTPPANPCKITTKGGGSVHLYVTSTCHNVTYFTP